MAVEIILPKIGFSTVAGKLSEWLLQDGSSVSAGAPLYAVEFDKSIQEVEAPASGKLKILKPANETYEVGTVIGVIE
jgi:pyruvate/2-oxoglutarate dehydrogenase complex dihydrolipoamide acyltransferase (E2) component